MKKLLISSALIAGFIFTGCQNGQTTEKAVSVTGIRQANLNSDSQNLPELNMNNTQPIPGKVKTQPASFNAAPPMIPHSIEGMVPITRNSNMCLQCHRPQAAKSMHITAIPPSHFVDNFEGDKKSSKLAGSRYNCTLCHAPQAKLDPVIENKFESLKK
jgi:cytochrome c-type protein NapB